MKFGLPRQEATIDMGSESLRDLFSQKDMRFGVSVSVSHSKFIPISSYYKILMSTWKASVELDTGNTMITRLGQAFSTL